jgi:uncharacterized protein YjbI with pentapeptide repeats
MRNSQLRERWGDRPIDFGRPSPFGITAEGYQDFRGVDIKWPRGLGKFRPNFKFRAKKLDLSFSRIEDAKFEGCVFEDCSFEKVSLRDIIVVRTVFTRCNFLQANFHGHGWGYSDVDFQSCSFESAKVRKVDFHQSRFIDTILTGDTWSSVEFKETQFKRCKFVGEFYDCRFWGIDPLRDDRAGSLESRGCMVDSDLNDAAFLFTDFPCEFLFQRIRLPKDGSMIIVSNRSLRDCANGMKSKPERIVIFQEALDIFGGEYLRQDNGFRVLSLHSLIAHWGESLGREFFDFLKSVSERYDGEAPLLVGNL